MENLKFEDLKLSKEIMKAIADMGFEEATPIQSQAIPQILEGKDIIGQAQTGTGKTAAFGVPILEKINLSDKNLQALVLCPTRELAIQVAEEIKKLSKYKKGIEIVPIYGGQPIERQLRSLKKNVQIVIGTPGRVIDHIYRHTLKTDKIKIIVLDEADEMLDMGFREDIEIILGKTPAERQTILFSATMPKAILDLTHKYQKNPKLIKVVHKALTVHNVEQYYFETNEHSKLEILSRLIDINNLKLSLVFCNTKKRVDDLVGHLQARGYSADGLHGDLKQTQRDKVMEKFRKGTVEILVATDVAARGIDVDDVEAVINYDVPQDEENYVHRIGRTGRAGKAGRAFTFVVGRDIYKIREIQNFTKAKIISKKIPSISDVEEIRMNQLLDKIKKVLKDGHLGKYVNTIETLTSENYTSIDVASALLKMAIGEQSTENTIIENTKKDTYKKDTYRDRGYREESRMATLFINVGKNLNIMPKDIVGSIAGRAGIPGKSIGSIKIFDDCTFVQIPENLADETIQKMTNGQIKGHKIKIELKQN